MPRLRLVCGDARGRGAAARRAATLGAAARGTARRAHSRRCVGHCGALRFDGELLGGCLAESLGGMADVRPRAGSGELELAPRSAGLGRYFGTDRGVLVIRTPADGSIKLPDGDVISAIGGRESRTAPPALSTPRSCPPGGHLTIASRREHKALVLELSMPAPQQLEGHAPPRPPAGPSAPPAPLQPASPPRGSAI